MIRSSRFGGTFKLLTDWNPLWNYQEHFGGFQFFTNSNFHSQNYGTFTNSSISHQQPIQPLTALQLSPCSLLNRAKNSFKTICYVCIILTANIKHSARVRNKRRFRFHPCAQCKLPRKCIYVQEADTMRENSPYSCLWSFVESENNEGIRWRKVCGKTRTVVFVLSVVPLVVSSPA